MMTKKNLAKAVTLSVLLMLPYGMAQAATLTELFDNPARLEKMAKKSLVENNAVVLIADEITK